MTDTLNKALLAFHKDAGELDLRVNRAGHTNKYLDLDGAMAQIRPLLVKHGLFARHEITVELREGKEVWLGATVIVHAESGESVSSGQFPIRSSKGDSQSDGSGLTYNRRYTLMAVLALVADNDDDGAGGKSRGGQKRTAGSGKINAAQRNQLMAALRANNLTTADGKAIVKRVADVDGTADIPQAKFDAVLKAIKETRPDA